MNWNSWRKVILASIVILLIALCGGCCGDAKDEKPKVETNPEILRLAAPGHVAREQMDEAARIIDASVEVAVVGDYCGIKRPVPTSALSKTIPIIDNAIHLSPADMDLIVLKACILDLTGQEDQAEVLRRVVLDKQPDHFEAKMWEQHPDNWRNVLHYPKWSEDEESLHPVMSRHLALEHRVQVVRDGLQKTLAVVAQVHGPALHPQTDVKMKWVLSETPYRPLVAWYLRISEPSADPSTIEAFLPIFKPMFMPMEGYSLVQQLASNPYCFVVLVRGDRVELNRRLVYDDKSVRQIREIAAQLRLAKAFLPKEKFKSAMQWHMNNFDMDKIQFD